MSDANFTPDFKPTYALTPFKFFMLQNFPYIAEDFDSITTYELMCKLAEQLNGMITNVNNVIYNNNELIEAYNQLQDYINNYFNNLDVQEEINNKIDAMAESGYFEDLLAKMNKELIDKVNSIVDETKYKNTVSDMISDEGLEAGDLVITKGFYTINDGGGANYNIRAKENEETFLLNTNILLTNNLVAELIVSNNKITTKQLGCKADGITDDSSIINKALEYCSENNINLILSKGTHLIENTIILNDNNVLVGESREESIIKASNNLDLVYHTICNKNAENIDARLAVNPDSPRVAQGYPIYTNYMNNANYNIKIKNLTIDGNWQGRNINDWNKQYINNQYTINREPGTGLELQWVENCLIKDIISKNNPQHNINVRGAAGTYSEGINVIGLGPSRYVLIQNCFVDNHRFDDGITTHDSEYIKIENCTAQCSNNVNGTYTQAISNGIEIDDGSRYVVVKDCISKWNVCGFQAKGHTNTPPAHDITFQNCRVIECHQAFSVSCTADSSTAYTNFDNRARNINILDCTIQNIYIFSNDENWNTTSLLVNFQNAINCKIENLHCILGNPTGLQNISNLQPYSYMRFRDYNSGIELKNITIENLKNQPKPETITFCPINIDGNSRNFYVKNIKYDGYPHDPFFKYSSSSIDGYCIINGIFATKLYNDDNIYYEFSENIKGQRENMMYLNKV